ncbi:MAG: hypothetical protein ACOX50_03250 [Patescibacteria group bacterium]
MTRQKNHPSKANRLLFIKNYLKNLDEHLKRDGLQNGMLNLIKWTKTPLAIEGLSAQLSQILKEEAVVVVANHPFQAEVFALLAALPPRKNAFLIATDEFYGILPHLDQHLIPVYVKHHSSPTKKEQMFLKLLHFFYPSKILPIDQAHKKNILRIDEASQKVNRGGLVIIFPEVRRREKWQAGVGYLLKNIKSNKKTYFVQAYIEGTTPKDYFRLIPLVSRFLPPFKITFAKPLEVNDIVNKTDDGKKTAALLAEQYYTWASSFINKPKNINLTWRYSHQLRLLLNAIILFIKANS